MNGKKKKNICSIFACWLSIFAGVGSIISTPDEECLKNTEACLPFDSPEVDVQSGNKGEK